MNAITSTQGVEGEGWVIGRPHEGGDVHIIPVNDSITHEWEDCPCLPRVEFKEGKAISGFSVNHNAWDGRK